VLLFLYLLAAIFLAYFAKSKGRNPALWFCAGVLLTPLGGSIALMLSDRTGWFRF